MQHRGKQTMTIKVIRKADRRINNEPTEEEMKVMEAIAAKYDITAQASHKLIVILMMNGYRFNAEMVRLMKCVTEQMEFIDISESSQEINEQPNKTGH